MRRHIRHDMKFIWHPKGIRLRIQRKSDEMVAKGKGAASKRGSPSVNFEAWTSELF